MIIKPGHVCAIVINVRSSEIIPVIKHAAASEVDVLTYSGALKVFYIKRSEISVHHPWHHSKDSVHDPRFGAARLQPG